MPGAKAVQGQFYNNMVCFAAISGSLHIHEKQVILKNDCVLHGYDPACYHVVYVGDRFFAAFV